MLIELNVCILSKENCLDRNFVFQKGLVIDWNTGENSSYALRERQKDFSSEHSVNLMQLLIVNIVAINTSLG
jgi:hypothetical protein